MTTTWGLLTVIRCLGAQMACRMDFDILSDYIRFDGDDVSLSKTAAAMSNDLAVDAQITSLESHPAISAYRNGIIAGFLNDRSDMEAAIMAARLKKESRE